MTLSINWLGQYDIYEGYGWYSMQLLEACSKIGGFDITPLTLFQFKFWPTRYFDMAKIDLNKPLLMIHPPDEEYITKAGRVWCYTMYESTRVLEEWVDNLNTFCDRLIVPHLSSAEAYLNSGLDKYMPIYIIPGGINPEIFYPFYDKSADRPYTFMVLADRGNRKGFDLGWKAFYDVFGKNPDVRMIFKMRQFTMPMAKEYLSDPRISILRTDTPTFADALQNIDCFLFPSRGEGFGLPPREAAACGIPTICTKWSGLDDNLEKWAYPIGYKLTKSRLPAGGKWAEPDYNELCERMEWCYNHRDEAKTFALSASKWLHENRTWAQTAAKLYKVMNEQLGSAGYRA